MWAQSVGVSNVMRRCEKNIVYVTFVFLEDILRYEVVVPVTSLKY
jgi:hypothetical protein